MKNLTVGLGAVLSIVISGCNVSDKSQIRLQPINSSVQQTLRQSQHTAPLLQFSQQEFVVSSNGAVQIQGYQNENSTYAALVLNPSGTVQAGVDLENGVVTSVMIEKFIDATTREYIDAINGVRIMTKNNNVISVELIEDVSAAGIKGALDGEIIAQDTMLLDGSGGTGTRSRCQAQVNNVLATSRNFTNAANNLDVATNAAWASMGAGALGGIAIVPGFPGAVVGALVGGLTQVPGHQAAQQAYGEAKSDFNNAARDLRVCM